MPVIGTSSPLYGIDDLRLGYAVAILTAASASSSATSLTLAAGQGAQFNNASVSDPIEISFGTERLYVTGVPSTDVLTVVRGRQGTTGAAIGNGATGYAIFEVDIGMAQNLTLDPNISQIEYQGDGTKVRIPVSEGISGKFNMEFWTEEFLQYIAGVTPVTANLPADETSRSYPQLGTYPPVRIRGRVRVIDTSVGGVSGHWRVEVPKALIQRPVTFGDIASGAPTKFEMNFTAVPTRLDIAGAPLVGVPSGEVVEILIAKLAA
jgi:hypothetical protein